MLVSRFFTAGVPEKLSISKKVLIFGLVKAAGRQRDEAVESLKVFCNFRNTDSISVWSKLWFAKG